MRGAGLRQKRRGDGVYQPASPRGTFPHVAEAVKASEVGKPVVVLPEFLRKDLQRHMDWYAEKGPEGLLFVGEKGKPFRRSTFGRK